jgi:hypothetical protein
MKELDEFRTLRFAVTQCLLLLVEVVVVVVVVVRGCCFSPPRWRQKPKFKVQTTPAP